MMHYVSIYLFEEYICLFFIRLSIYQRPYTHAMKWHDLNTGVHGVLWALFYFFQWENTSAKNFSNRIKWKKIFVCHVIIILPSHVCTFFSFASTKMQCTEMRFWKVPKFQHNNAVITIHSSSFLEQLIKKDFQCKLNNNPYMLIYLLLLLSFPRFRSGLTLEKHAESLR